MKREQDKILCETETDTCSKFTSLRMCRDLKSEVDQDTVQTVIMTREELDEIWRRAIEDEERRSFNSKPRIEEL